MITQLSHSSNAKKSMSKIKDYLLEQEELELFNCVPDSFLTECEDNDNEIFDFFRGNNKDFQKKLDDEKILSELGFRITKL